jgi:hypothetical protein
VAETGVLRGNYRGAQAICSSLVRSLKLDKGVVTEVTDFQFDHTGDTQFWP